MDDKFLSLERLIAEIEWLREEALARESQPYPRNNPIASDLGECAREYVLAMTRWQERPGFPLDLIARFQRGRLIEDAVLRDLSALGITVRAERRPFELKDKAGRVVLRGRVDGFVEWDRRQYPMEIKSVNPNAFRTLVTLDDFRRSPFFSKWPRQLWAYCYAHDEEAAFFLLDDCLGHWRLVPVALDYAEMEAILRRCEAAVEYRDAGTLPDYHPDPDVCRRCWAFGRVCIPPSARAGYAAADDPELEGKIERWAALRGTRDEWDDLDAEIKAAVKGKDGLVVGRWLVTGKSQQRHYKALPERTTEAWVTKIEPFAEFEKLDAGPEHPVSELDLVSSVPGTERGPAQQTCVPSIRIPPPDDPAWKAECAKLLSEITQLILALKLPKRVTDYLAQTKLRGKMIYDPDAPPEGIRAILAELHAIADRREKDEALIDGDLL